LYAAARREFVLRTGQETPGAAHFFCIAARQESSSCSLRKISKPRARNYVVEAEQLETFTRALAGRIAQNSALAISVIKEQLRILSGSQVLTPETFEKIQALRRLVFESGDYRERIDAFLHKKKTAPKGG